MAKSFTAGSPAKLIFAFTLPLIAGNIFQQMYSLIDTLIVGRTIGVNALAAVGCTGGLMFFMIGFVIGLTTGFSILTGQRFGAGDHAGVRQSAAACLLLSAACTLVLTIVSVFLARPMLELMQTPPEIIDDAYAFIRVICLGIAATMLFNMLSNLIRALGDSRTPLLFLIFAAALNVVLELLFILQFSMGVAGAAWATVLAQASSGALCAFYIARRMPALMPRGEDWKVAGKLLRELLRLGLPMAFQSSIIAIGAIILQIALNHLGPVSVAAYAAAQKIDMVAAMPMMSFGMAMAAFTAQNYGAQRFERIRRGVRQCMMMSVAFSVAIGAVNILFGPELIELFVGEGEPQVVALAHTYLNINGSLYFLLSLLFIFRFTLQGLGKSLVPTIAGVIELLMRTFAAIVMAEAFGFAGVCFANPLAWLGACVPLGIAYFVEIRRLTQIRET